MKSCLCLLILYIFSFSEGFSQTQLSKDTTQFRKIILTSDFISEGVATGDVNHDGQVDILAGSFWFEAPDWKRHEIAKGLIFDPDTTFSNSFLDYSMDVNQDGWIDLIRFGYPGQEVVWYENPHNEKRLWAMHKIRDHAGNESPAFVDIDGDGRQDILCNDPVEKKMIWLKSPSEKGIQSGGNILSAIIPTSPPICIRMALVGEI